MGRYPYSFTDDIMTVALFTDKEVEFIRLVFKGYESELAKSILAKINTEDNDGYPED